MTEYVVVDFEFNQAFNFAAHKSAAGEWGCPEEIIQIGAVKLDEGLNEVGSFNCFVRPYIYRRLHPFVRKVTGIRQGALDRAQYFPECFERFSRFLGAKKSTVFCTWGPDDMKALFRNMIARKIDTSHTSKKYINVQSLAANSLGIEGCIALSKAVDAFDLPAELEYHDALHDAIYTAEVFRSAIGKKQPADINISDFDLAALRRHIEIALPGVDMRGLFNFAKARFKHELTDEERYAVARIYSAGQARTFEGGVEASVIEVTEYSGEENLGL